MKRRGWALRSRTLACKTAGGKIIGAGQAGLDRAFPWRSFPWRSPSPCQGRQRPRTGVTAERILFGQSAALGGPAADLGTEMRRGIAAAFEEVNGAGGVGGRRLELRSYDDRYEPELAIANTRS